MPVKNPKEVFVLMLSGLRQGTERANNIFRELSQVVQDPDIKQALEARTWVSDNILSTQDEAFKLIGEKPGKINDRLHDVFIEDFRRELAEIQSPEAKRLFVLMKWNHLVHLRIGAYMALVAAADVTGHYGVGVLLESCLAEELAFVERTRRIIRNIVEARVAAKTA
jgi:ferritin-like metal-binding protein YciE